MECAQTAQMDWIQRRLRCFRSLVWIQTIWLWKGVFFSRKALNSATYGVNKLHVFVWLVVFFFVLCVHNKYAMVGFFFQSGMDPDETLVLATQLGIKCQTKFFGTRQYCHMICLWSVQTDCNQMRRFCRTPYLCTNRLTIVMLAQGAMTQVGSRQHAVELCFSSR